MTQKAVTRTHYENHHHHHHQPGHQHEGNLNARDDNTGSRALGAP